jgi:hypothetical protein
MGNEKVPPPGERDASDLGREADRAHIAVFCNVKGYRPCVIPAAVCLGLILGL